MSRLRRFRRLGVPTALLWVGAAILAGELLGGVLAGFGGVYVVSSGSMAPAVQAGDAVVARSAPAAQVETGQVVTFRDIERGVFVTHRVASINREGTQLRFTTRGDANSGSESWTAGAETRLAVMVARIPAVGRLADWPVSEAGQALLYLLTALIFATGATRWIWEPSQNGLLTGHVPPAGARHRLKIPHRLPRR